MNTAIATLQSQGIIKSRVYSYSSLSSARSACYEHSTKPSRVILGEDLFFWVVTPADAERLIRAGYEVAL